MAEQTTFWPDFNEDGGADEDQAIDDFLSVLLEIDSETLESQGEGGQGWVSRGVRDPINPACTSLPNTICGPGFARLVWLFGVGIWGLGTGPCFCWSNSSQTP